MDKITMIDAFDEEQQQALIRSVAQHNLGSDELVKIAEISSKLGDRGVRIVKVLEFMLERHKQDNFLDIKINE